MFGPMKIYGKSIVKLKDEVIQHLVNEAQLKFMLDITLSKDLENHVRCPLLF